MSKRILAFAAVVLLLASAVPARAQFLGYVGLQTTQQVALNAVTVAGPSALLRNIGQSGHYVSYTSVGCTTVDQVRIIIEGSWDGTTFFQISNAGTDPISGLIFAHGYYPAVRVNLTAFSGFCQSLTARYSGTGTAPGEPAGLSLSAQSINRSATFGNLSANRDVQTPALNGHTGGVIYFNLTQAGPGCAGQAAIQILASTVGTGSIKSSQVLKHRFDVNQIPAGFTIAVPSIPAETILVSLQVITVTGGANCTLDMTYAFDRSSNLRPHIEWSFLTRTTTGIFCTTETCPGGSYQPLNAIHVRPSLHTVQLITTGAPTSCTFELMGSVDGNTFFSLSGPVSCISSTMFQVLDRPVNYLRGDLNALAGGAAPGVTFTYIGEAN